MAKQVRIQSSITITVTSGLQHQNVTNPDAHIPDRLKISPAWPKRSVQIMKGVGTYPAEIKEWATVKNLVKDKLITIGEEINDEPEAKSEVSKPRKKSLSELSDSTNEQGE